MAQCDQGYLCEVCGEEVEFVEGSDLYLRYILGEVEARELLSTPERHLRCNPVVAQFIVDPAFPPVTVEGIFSKAELDAVSVRQREELVTRAWRRLQEVRTLGISISEYPLPEVLARRAPRITR
ncbi:MAG: hypothetical protein DWH91_05990 [Planctomycetota bacterium]|nr:MAG: hypothetical protein DWH91_05990 [Planctomycetota bacterium]